MSKNEYRRAFIMLRAVEPGYGGHVRLEARVLSGSLYFIVTAPEGAGELTALLAGQRGGAYSAASLGVLRRDRRGQLTLARQIDPRNIEGRPLDAYQWVVIAAGGRGEIVLTGNVNGSRPMDPAALSRAVRDRLDVRESAPRVREGVPAADLPEPGEALPSGQPPTQAGASPAALAPQAAGVERASTETASTPLQTSKAENADALPAGTTSFPARADSEADGSNLQGVPEAAKTPEPEEACDVKIYTISRSRVFAAHSRQSSDAVAAGEAAPKGTPAPETPAADSTGSASEESSPTAAPAEASPSAAAGTTPTALFSTPFAAAEQTERALIAAPETASPAEPSFTALPEADSAKSTEAPAAPPVRTAAKVLGLDIARPWPGCLEPLRRLFATQAPLEGAPDGEHVYVRAPMPEKSGFDACLVGLRTEDGAPVRLRYALPARRSPEPPPGLDGYRWLGDGESGWWIADTDSF